METFSSLLTIYVGNSPVDGEFPTQRPVTRSFDVSFDLCLNEWLSKHYIMAGRAFVVAKEVFIMETVVFWHCDNG